MFRNQKLSPFCYHCIPVIFHSCICSKPIFGIRNEKVLLIMALQLKKVLITDDVDPECIAILNRNGVEVDFNTKLAKDKPALIAAIPSYDGLIVRSGTKVTADVIEASNLSIIGRAGTGTDNIDSDAATKKGIIVMNTPGGNTISACELTCTFVCALSRNLASAAQSMKEGRWDRKLYMGTELQGKTLAVVGLGRIGREVANRMRSFGMETIGYDPLVSAEESAAFGVDWYELKDLWGKADYITVHVPLIPPTRNLINDDVFSKCKRGVKIINCARGGIVEEAALLAALNDGRCGGAGLDVYEQEPPKDLTLVQHNLVIATPHLGASTKEAQSRVAEEIAEQFIEARDGVKLFGALNAPALVNAMSPSSQALVKLATSLGLILTSLSGATPKAVTLTVSGDSGAMKSALRSLETAVCVGLLQSSSTTRLNLVNGPQVAKQQGVQVTSVVNEAPSAGLTLSTDTASVSGLVDGTSCFLSAVDNAPMSGCLLTSGREYLLLNYENEQALTQAIAAVTDQGLSLVSLACSSQATDCCKVKVALIGTSQPISNQSLSNSVTFTL